MHFDRAGAYEPASSAAGPAVLLVDDEAALRELIAEILVDEGFSVRSAPDGPAALKLLHEQGGVDVLISDLGLPRGMDGLRLAESARAICPMLPVVFITGNHDSPGRQGGDAPRTEVMLKPFALMDLVAKVREILAGPA